MKNGKLDIQQMRMRISCLIDEDPDAKLARVFNVCPGTIWRWKNQRSIPRLPNLYNLSKYYGVSMSFLFDGVW